MDALTCNDFAALLSFEMKAEGIVADGAERLRRALASKKQFAAIARKGIIGRIMNAIRRLLRLPSLPEKSSSDEDPSPYSLFGKARTQTDRHFGAADPDRRSHCK